MTSSENALIADAAGARQIVADKYPGDRGLLVAFVASNLVHLAPGDPRSPRRPRCTPTISGTAIELIDPSDSVMRAGLTTKTSTHLKRLIKVLGESQDASVIQQPTR